MKIVYRAFDGTEFDTRQECEAFEAKWLSIPQMCNADGIATENFRQAYCIRITTEYEAEWLKNQIAEDPIIEATDKREFRKYETEDMIGVWHWDSKRTMYQLVEPRVVKFIEGTQGE